MKNHSIFQGILVVLLVTLSLVSTVYNIEIFNPFTQINRRWFISGEFSSVVQPDGTTLTAQNAAAFKSRGSGTWENIAGLNETLQINGKVSKIFVDSCRTIYIGGEFTSVGNTQVSYLAKYELFEKKWQPIISDLTFTGVPTIRDISVDCFNKFNPLEKKCKCDVYVVGKFVAQHAGSTFNSFFKYDANDVRIDSLGSNFNADTDIVGVHKREFDVNFLSSSDDQVWFAGRMNGEQKVRVWDRNRDLLQKENPKWDYISTNIAGKITSFHYFEATRGSDMIYFGGDNMSVSGKCEAVCSIQRTNKEVKSVGKTGSRLPVGSVVSDIFRDRNDNVYAAGNFTLTFDGTPYMHLSKCKGDNEEGEFLPVSIRQRGSITQPIVSLTVCLDPICDGTVFFAFVDGSVAFMSKDGEFQSYKNAVNGKVTNVFTIITNGSSKMIFSSLMIVLSIVLSLFLSV